MLQSHSTWGNWWRGSKLCSAVCFKRFRRYIGIDGVGHAFKPLQAAADHCTGLP